MDSSSAAAEPMPGFPLENVLDSDYNSGADESSKSRNSFQPLNFSSSTFDDVEDGDIQRRRRRGRRKGWWYRMVARARRRLSMETEGSLKDDADGPLLQEYGAGRLKNRKGRSWLECCMCGGISGMALLAFLLALNLVFSYISLTWWPDVDHVLDNWGRTGTGTEGLAWYPTDFTRDIIPIPCHSHNDYWRRVPLFSAIRAGCTGVEADVWLLDDDLYIGHNTASLTRNRTFQSLYINPLVKILEHQNPKTDFYNGTQHGVFDTDSGKSLVLLIDVKTSGADTWPWVLAQLQPLRDRDWLTFVENGIIQNRPVTVVGTGNTPFDVLTHNTTYRDAFFDAPLDAMWEPRNVSDETFSMSEDEDEEDSSLPIQPLGDAGQGKSGTTPRDGYSTLNSYYSSVSFPQAVGHLWRGHITQRQLRIIRGHVRGAHRRGLKARYWDLPAWPVRLRNHVWDVLMREGVDVLNVDDLRAASRREW